MDKSMKEIVEEKVQGMIENLKQSQFDAVLNDVKDMKEALEYLASKDAFFKKAESIARCAINPEEELSRVAKSLGIDIPQPPAPVANPQQRQPRNQQQQPTPPAPAEPAPTQPEPTPASNPAPSQPPESSSTPQQPAGTGQSEPPSNTPANNPAQSGQPATPSASQQPEGAETQRPLKLYKRILHKIID